MSTPAPSASPPPSPARRRRARRAAAAKAQRTREVEPPSQRDLSIRVRDLHVEYELYENRRAALRERIVTQRGPSKSLVRAVRGVSFDVYEGEAVGVVGSNGSGKSTLLSTIAGLLPSSRGEILVSEEPKLLGVGATLLPRATGYRNIRLGCLALGLSEEQVDEALPDIVEFTELGEALDRPLQDVLVGDAGTPPLRDRDVGRPADPAHRRGADGRRPQVPAQGAERINALLGRAGTLMLVSHNVGEIRQQCTRGLWIERGKLRADGPANEVLREYRAFIGPE
ncbi:MAG: ATP-binding cassette domain-containing protein [Ilumatobacteraceae bacterium]